MATIYDEWGNPIGDDGSTYGYDDPSLYNNPFMQQEMPGQNYSTAKWNFGQAQPVGQNVYNQWLTGQKNLAQLQTNPSFAYNAMVATGQPTMDLNGLLGLDANGNPYMGSGGGGGGGGGGYNPNFMTNNLDALRNAPEGSPENLIYTGITTGQSPLAIKRSLREGGAYDTETLKVVDQQVDDAFSEYAGAQRNQMAGMNQPAQQTPVQEWLAKNGLINPTTQYTANDLPADVDVGWAGMQGGKLAQDAITEATATGARIKGINDQRTGLRDKAVTNNAARNAQLYFLEQNAEDMMKRPGTTGGISYDAKTGKPIYADFTRNGQHTTIAPKQLMDTGDVGGWAGGFLRPIRDAAAQTVNPTGDVARMAMLRRASQAQERRKADLVASARSAPAYDQAVRQLAAQQVQAQGRTPARDAQRALINYMRQGTMG